LSQFTVERHEQGQTLAAVIRQRLQLSWGAAKDLVEKKKVRVTGHFCVEPARRLKIGQVVSIEHGGPKKTKSLPRPTLKPVSRDAAIPDGIIVRFADEHILVVEKPPHLTTMRHREEAAEFGPRGKKFLPKTLADFLPMILNDSGPIIPVHRIDKETSGIVVFARTPEAAQHLGRQFRNHTIERIYLAIVRGRPRDGRIESWLIRDRGDGRRGSGPKESGERAITHVRSLQDLGSLSLVECKLETGRTHQIRIHLGEAGCPLAGERIYDRPIHGQPHPDPSGAPRVLLHAAVLGLTHPMTGKPLRWESKIPEDFSRTLKNNIG
jgi:23S rRNA pseudouridine1911/1915/1917 synthase